MSLDVLAVAGQVRQMGEEIASAQSDVHDCVRWARRLMRDNSQRYDEIKASILASREARTARAALPMEPLATRRAAPAPPAAYTCAAADGSQAEPDRHGHVSYYLINTGAVLLRYGAEPFARFYSLPRLYYRRDDLSIIEERGDDWPPTQQPREAPIDAEILAMKRSLAEVEDLARLAQEMPQDPPPLLMLDGTLTLFAKSTGEDVWVVEQLKRHYCRALERIQPLGIPVVGFISRSNATWVMDMLRVALCPRHTESCAFCRTRVGGPQQGCALADLRDRFLYDAMIDEPEWPSLQPGERSALFQLSASLYKDYAANEPAMFYLNTGREIAQVQLPMWAARRSDLVDRVHSLVYEQCVNGGGYPTALTRAHEQAIITAADRETLDSLVLAQLIKLGVRVPVSEKARSKQVRGI